MRFQVLEGSRVCIDLRAAGLLRAVAHSPTLEVPPEQVVVDFADGEAAVSARFRVNAVEVPEGMSAADRDKMRDNLRGPEVLDAGRFPWVEFRGHYSGTLEGGTLAGDLVVRGIPAALSMTIGISREAKALLAVGSWEGKLTALGVRPYKAWLGAIKLEDWIRLRIEARFREANGSSSGR